ncbi:MAG TPA: glycosyltransferase family 1 protein [Gaiellaceae bacterium]|nr:glycosyltransferase family 1 protein [Gaiellaceae bacterium]
MTVERLAIDATFIRRGGIPGAEHMLRNLVGGLREHGVPVEVLARAGEWDRAAGVELFEAPRRLDRFAAASYAAAVRRRSYDAFLGANYFVPPVVTRGRRTCGVIHDLQHVHYPELFSARKRRWLDLAQGTTLRVADVVVAISSSVREDLVSVHGRKWADRIVVIPNPVSWERFSDGDAPSASYPYVLAVAAHYPHKNLDTLVRAFGRLKQSPGLADLRLVLVGPERAALRSVIGEDRLVQALAESPVADRIVQVGGVDDATLGAWYRGASVFVLPSLFEGFGMPAVEAMGFGIPTVTTRCGALPETTLGLASYVDDPLDPDELAGLLDSVLRDRERHVPSAETIEKIRGTYAPSRVAALYLEALGMVA